VQPDTAADQKYLRAALTNQYNVILIAGAAAFAAALASWAPLIVAFLGEVVWLFIGPRLDSFRGQTDTQNARASSAKAIEGLPPEYARRVASVENDVREIDALCAARTDLSAEQRLDVNRRMRPALQAFVNVSAMQQRLQRALAQAPLGQLQAEVSALHQSLATETDLGVRASLRRALSVAERRIKQIEGSDAAGRSLELSLSTLQKSIAMLKEGAAGLSTASELCAEIDAAAGQLTRAAALEAERDSELAESRVSALPHAFG
jgi:hypothetical protein